MSELSFGLLSFPLKHKTRLIDNETITNFQTVLKKEKKTVAPSIQVVPGVKVTTSGFNSRANSESKTSYTHGSNSQQFRSYEFLKFLKIRKESF